MQVSQRKEYKSVPQVQTDGTDTKKGDACVSSESVGITVFRRRVRRTVRWRRRLHAHSFVTPERVTAESNNVRQLVFQVLPPGP